MRRGVAFMVDFIPRMVVLAIAIVVIGMLVRFYADRDIEAANISTSAHLYRLYYGDVIMYQDNTTKRIYPGTVDMKRFTDARLAEIFPSEARISSCLAVSSQSCPELGKSICYNKQLFELHHALAGASGAGGAAVLEQTYPVMLKYEEKTCTGQLNITVVRPNQ